MGAVRGPLKHASKSSDTGRPGLGKLGKRDDINKKSNKIAQSMLGK